jgi:hypothetical protein
MFQAAPRNIVLGEPYMGQFNNHEFNRHHVDRQQRIGVMITKPQPFSVPFSDRRVSPAGPRPPTTFPGWGPKI